MKKTPTKTTTKKGKVVRDASEIPEITVSSHIGSLLHRASVNVGSMMPEDRSVYVATRGEDGSITVSRTKIRMPEGLERITIETIGNACDNTSKSRWLGDPTAEKPIEVVIEGTTDRWGDGGEIPTGDPSPPADGGHGEGSESSTSTTLSTPVLGVMGVKNYGAPMPIARKEFRDVGEQWIPWVAFGHPLSSSQYGANINTTAYDEGVVKLPYPVSSRNGLGAKLGNILSLRAVLECADGKVSYRQEWRKNMTEYDEPTIDVVSDESVRYTHISYQVDLPRFSYPGGYTPVDLDRFRMVCLNYSYSLRIPMQFNGEPILEPLNILQYARLLHGENRNITVGYLWPIDPSVGASVKVARTKVMPTTEQEETGQEPIYLERAMEGVSAYQTGYPLIEYALIDTPGANNSDNPGFVSFFNGIYTKHGGSHVAAVYKALTTHLGPLINAGLGKEESKATKSKIKGDVMRHVSLIVSCYSLDRADMGTNTKDKIILPFPVKVELSQSVQKALEKFAVVDAARAERQLAEERSLLSRASPSKALGKLIKANKSHVKGEVCTLCLCEGDSAAKYVLAITQDDRDHYGILPLRGKCLNARQASTRKVRDNDEFKAIIQAVGFDRFPGDVDFTLDENYNKLYYKRIAIMTDEDADGEHIRVLIVQFLQRYFPSLLRRGETLIYDENGKVIGRTTNLGLVDEGGLPMLPTSGPVVPTTDANGNSDVPTAPTTTTLPLPLPSMPETIEDEDDVATVDTIYGYPVDIVLSYLITAQKGDVMEGFYTKAEYDAWVAEDASRSKWEVTYRKGLGSWSTHEIPIGMPMKKMRVVYDGQAAEDALEMALGAKQTDARKEWIKQYDPDAPVPIGDRILLSTLVRIRLRRFAVDNVERMIPGLDGFKQSHRKIMTAILKRWDSDKKILDATYVRTSAMTGIALEATQYDHGEVSIQDSLARMACNYMGSNNMLLIEGHGQFADRFGNKAAAARYTHMRPAKILPLLIKRADLDITPLDPYGGEYQEIRTVLPLILINGDVGLASGWSTVIPPHYWRSVGQYFLDLIDGAEEPSLFLPYYEGFTGTVKIVDRKAIKEALVEMATVYAHDPDRKAESDDVVLGDLGAETYILVIGRYYIDKATGEVVVTELPPGVTGDKYKLWLENLKSERVIKDYHYHQDVAGDKVRFTIKGFPDPNYTTLRLRKAISYSNMPLLDVHKKVVEYPSVRAILTAWRNERLDWYEQRMAHETKRLEDEVHTLSERRRLISLVLENRSIFIGGTTADVYALLDEHGIDHKAYGSISLPQVTIDTIERFDRTIEDRKAHLERYRLYTAKSLWREEIVELLAFPLEAERTKAQVRMAAFANKRRNKGAKGKGRGKGAAKGKASPKPKVDGTTPKTTKPRGPRKTKVAQAKE